MFDSNIIVRRPQRIDSYPWFRGKQGCLEEVLWMPPNIDFTVFCSCFIAKAASDGHFYAGKGKGAMITKRLKTTALANTSEVGNCFWHVGHVGNKFVYAANTSSIRLKVKL